ncbi:Rhodanese domain-containing protein [Favolaschia claudopus]|uniref:Rhodanese domain-containing protein n=1 Tax=Favolaschia claudopus TaxID=2862362 RepID=A0AAW0D924_9AGAR
MRCTSVSLFLLLFWVVSGYQLVDNFAGLTFFDNWDFYGNYDNLTLGDVVWLDVADAFTQQLAYVNAAGNVIIKVDNFSNVPFNQKRNSVRITTKSSYALGTLWIIDAVHVPYGCSVWPSIWTMGPSWPAGGEIDIFEAINLNLNNQYALHTTPGCLHTTPLDQKGVSSIPDCSQSSGCLVGETMPNSYQAGFAAAGGGVWATQFDYTGLFNLPGSIWFWSRPNVPQSIVQSTAESSIDLSDWGPPSASYINSTCTVENFFGPQKMFIDITLCGQYAGLPEQYLATCAGQGPTGKCYDDNVVGPGNNYDNAYFEIKSIRAYTTAAPGATGVSALDNSHSGGKRTIHPMWSSLLLALLSVAFRTSRNLCVRCSQRLQASSPHPGARFLGEARRAYASKHSNTGKEGKYSKSTADLVPGSKQPITDEAARAEYAKADEKMKAAVEWYRKECAGVESRANGRVTPAVLDPVRVRLPASGDHEYRLEEVATVGVRDGSTLIITIFDEDTMKHVEKGLYDSKIPNIVPQKHDARTIKIPIPKPTVESNTALVTAATRKAEDVRVQIRKQHQTSLKRGNYKKHSIEMEEFQKLVDRHIADVEKIVLDLKRATTVGGKKK